MKLQFISREKNLCAQIREREKDDIRNVVPDNIQNFDPDKDFFKEE